LIRIYVIIIIIIIIITNEKIKVMLSQKNAADALYKIITRLGPICHNTMQYENDFSDYGHGRRTC